MQQIFERQYQASRDQLACPPETRLDRLSALARMVRENEPAICAAISADFGNRATGETQMAEILPTLTGIRHARRHLRRWMRPRRVATPLHLRPARGHLQPMPLGVVGIVAPWNYPLYLTTGPLIGALAAGNRAMVKASEHAPAFAAWLAETAPRYFAPETLAIITGETETARAFTALPFDHLLFTGSTAVGRHVMAAAAQNLTPVTLELGGKSPVILTESAHLPRAIDRVMTGKLLNAGQTCVAPDYVLIPRDKRAAFIAGAQAWMARHYPNIAQNPDYTHIINDAQFARLTRMIDSARQAGATLTPLTDTPPDPERRLMPPLIVTDAPADCALLQEEIFGPVLPLIATDGPKQAMAEITARPRPLAAYLFGEDPKRIAQLQRELIAGGTCVNDTILHVAHENLPFGGVGASGLGSYHGQAGFDRFSHLKPVFTQARLNGMSLLAPPYKARFKTLMRSLKRFG